MKLSAALPATTLAQCSAALCHAIPHQPRQPIGKPTAGVFGCTSTNALVECRQSQTDACAMALIEPDQPRRGPKGSRTQHVTQWSRVVRACSLQSAQPSTAELEKGFAARSQARGAPQRTQARADPACNMAHGKQHTAAGSAACLMSTTYNMARAVTARADDSLCHGGSSRCCTAHECKQIGVGGY
jgi:hypothetical protein